MDDAKYLDWLKQMMGLGQGLYGSQGTALNMGASPQPSSQAGTQNFGYGNNFAPQSTAPQQSPYFEGYQNMSRGF